MGCLYRAQPYMVQMSIIHMCNGDSDNYCLPTSLFFYRKRCQHSNDQNRRNVVDAVSSRHGTPCVLPPLFFFFCIPTIRNLQCAGTHLRFACFHIISPGTITFTVYITQIEHARHHYVCLSGALRRAHPLAKVARACFRRCRSRPSPITQQTVHADK